MSQTLKDIRWTFDHTCRAVGFFLRGCIRWCILIKALRERPMAVYGRDGCYILDRDFAEAMFGQPD